MANSTRVEHFTAPDIILKYWANLKNTLAYLMANQDRKFCKTCFGEPFQKKFFSSSLKNKPNKLECLSQVSLSCLV